MGPTPSWQNKSMIVFESTDETWARTERCWRHACTMEVYFLMESSEIAKIK